MREPAAVAERPRRAPGGILSRARSAGSLTDLRTKRAATIAVAFVYAAFAIKLTWPLVTDLHHTIFGSYGDLTGSIAGVRELVEHHLNPFLPGTIHDFSAPDGQPVEWPQNIASFTSVSVLYALTAAFGAVAAFGIFILVGFVASGTSMFLLVRRLTVNPWVAALIGWAFAFYPFAVIKSGGHVHFVHGWLLVFVLWRMLELYERPTIRNGVLVGIVTVIAVAWTPYFLLIAGIEYAVLFVIGLARPLVERSRDFKLHLRAQLVGAAIVIAFGLTLVIISSLSVRGTGVAPRSIQALYVYSARPLEYVVPPIGNMIFGHTTGPFLARHLHGSNFAENTLYVGVSLILLSLVALVGAAWRRLPGKLGQVVLTVALMGGVAALWSAPPKVTILGKLIPFPALITFHISSGWRVYTRFVMVVMLALCVLAAIGLNRILSGRPRVAQVVILVVVAAVVYVDLHVPGVGTTKLRQIPVYSTVRKLPPGIIADYPLEPNGHGDYSTEFEQDWLQHPVVNGYAQGSLAETRAMELASLANPETPGRLAALGVRYVLNDHVPIEAGVTPPGKPGRGLQLIRDDGHAALYRVVAAPRPLVTLGPNFYPPDPGPPRLPVQWFTQNGEVELLAGCSRCSGRLVVQAQSFAQPRRLTLVAPDGRPVATRRIGLNRQQVSFPVSFRHRQTFEFKASPGPEAIRKVLKGSSDPRSVSVSITDARLIVGPAR